MGHQALSSEGRQLLPQHLADRPAAGRLLRLLQGDLLQGRPPQPTGQRGQAEEKRDGRGGEDCDAGLLPPRRRQLHVHGLTGGSDHAGVGEPAQCQGTRPFTGELCGRGHSLWDVQTVGLWHEHMDLNRLGGNERKLRDNNVKFSNYNLLNHAIYYVDSVLMAVL